MLAVIGLVYRTLACRLWTPLGILSIGRCVRVPRPTTGLCGCNLGPVALVFPVAEHRIHNEWRPRENSGVSIGALRLSDD